MKSANYRNFYENVSEARYRLLNTYITYDGTPYLVLAICDHTEPYKMYLLPASEEGRRLYVKSMMPSSILGSNDPTLGPKMDEYIKANPLVIRKDINSKKFNCFRPYPLGMINAAGEAYYLERRPNRPHREQGLMTHCVSTFDTMGNRQNGMPVSALSDEFRDCVLGVYPSLLETVKALSDPRISNKSVAIHRDMAIVRGSRFHFLSYQGDIVGELDDLSLTLNEDCKYLIETISELSMFKEVN